MAALSVHAGFVWKLAAIPLLMAASAHAAILEGVVLESRSGAPLARASVQVEAVRGTAKRGSALTDSAGRFRFEVTDGVYMVTAERQGYARSRFGERAWNKGGTPIALPADGHFHAAIRLRKLGVVAGQVVDENGVGMQGVAVSAVLTGRGGQLVGGAITDDQGVFRIAGLRPGRYLVRTSARQLEDGKMLLPTYFGQTPSPAQARAVEVALEQETSGLRIEPVPGALFTVSGRVLGIAGGDVSLVSEGQVLSSGVGPGGEFQFSQVPPGEYELQGQWDHAGIGVYQRLNVGASMGGLSVQAGPLPEVAVHCEEREGARVDPKDVFLFLERAAGGGEHRDVLHCGDRKRVGPGRWRASAEVQMKFFLERLQTTPPRQDPTELLAQPGVPTEVRVRLSARVGRLSGTVKTGDARPAIGAPVYLMPIDGAPARRAGGIQFARSDPEGRFQFGGLAPGKYRVISTFGLELKEAADWAGLTPTIADVKEGPDNRIELSLTELP